MIRNSWFIKAVLVFSLALMAAQAFAQVEEEIAFVVTINGRLDWRQRSDVPWGIAYVGLRLRSGNELRTSPLSRASIVFISDGSRVLINEDTELVVQAKGVGFQGRQNRVKMFVGEVYNKIKSGRSFEVETPSAVASVRGTEFDVVYDQFTGITVLTVVEGLVELANQLGRVLGGANTQTSAGKETPPTAPETKSEAEVEDITAWTEEVQPKWRLNVVPQGIRYSVGDVFNIRVSAILLETGQVDPKANFTLASFSSNLPELVFSTDGGGTWDRSPTVTLSNGERVLQAKGTKVGSASIEATAPDCSPGRATVTIKRVLKRRTIKLKFENEPKTETKEITIELEEKE
ncbi:MAG: FecR domain-containing protein [Candidatus Latescibacteria bacterium]|nr:FecR domain-containing protein [Candidatus Latescibacterota bacterium]